MEALVNWVTCTQMNWSAIMDTMNVHNIHVHNAKLNIDNLTPWKYCVIVSWLKEWNSVQWKLLAI